MTHPGRIAVYLAVAVPSAGPPGARTPMNCPQVTSGQVPEVEKRV